jgi:hypothetical protein
MTVKPPGPDERGDDPRAIAALPGLARVAASAAWHTTGWAVQNSARGGARLLKAAVSPESAATLVDDAQKAVRKAARDLVDVADLEDRVRNATPATTAAETVVAAASKVAPPKKPTRDPARDEAAGHLRRRGEELMRKSRDVRYEEDAHPAYDRILEELAPDEGRILRLLLLGGPQPAVDVRTGGPLGMFSSELIAPGLSMIGARAGCRYVDRVPSYLNNLFRLGMIWFSRETLPDAHRYQVIEAQPDVLEAMHSVRFAKLVRRSIHLTPFGEDFCRDGLGLATEIPKGEHLPEHHAPAEKTKTAEPPKLSV